MATARLLEQEQYGPWGRRSQYLSNTEITPAYPIQPTAAANPAAAEQDSEGLLVFSAGAPAKLSIPAALLPFMAPVVKKMAELCRLPANWNSYNARPISQPTAFFALRVLAYIVTERTPPPTVVPTVSGGIQFEWHTGGIDLEIEATTSGAVEYYYEDRRIGEIQEGESKETYKELRRFIAKLPSLQ